ncbi:YqjF family protein [Halomicrobium salinisoli]|uniref:YqjF family protein n=1 Tax=Halomicrobium salinisoli TaxID=2878391 RepID=UPI001CF08CAE|nr:DUF2071 domain-containing protein [Halomicrobium salinisoli]
MNSGVEPLAVAVSDVLFCHWPIDEDAAEAVVPPWLSPDALAGSAWASVVALRMDRFDAFGLPVREGLEAVNLRTYVRGPSGDRGVYFRSLDATDRLAVGTARRLFRLPYHRARIDRSESGGKTTVLARRCDGSGAGVTATFSPEGEPDPPEPDTLHSFLTERYRYFTEGPLGTRLVGSVGHEPWPLQPVDATVEVDGLLSAEGIETDGDPLYHYSPGVRIRIGPPGPVRSAPAGRRRDGEV